MTNETDHTAPEPSVVTSTDVSVAGPEMKKKDLIEEVTAKTGLKRGVVKEAVEGMLDVLGAALAEGKLLNMQPLGKIQVLNEKDTPNAVILKAKIRQVKALEDREDQDDTAVDAAAEDTPESVPENAETRRPKLSLAQP